MRVARSCEATCDVQLAVEAGWSLIVDMDSCTEEGWVYAAAVVKRGEDASPHAEGWIPMSCLEGLEF